MPRSHHFCFARVRNDLADPYRDLAHPERALLLQRRCEREEERRHECEDLGHRRRSLCPLADSRNVVEPDDLVDEVEPLRPWAMRRTDDRRQRRGRRYERLRSRSVEMGRRLVH